MSNTFTSDADIVDWEPHFEKHSCRVLGCPLKSPKEQLKILILRLHPRQHKPKYLERDPSIQI